VTIQLGLLMAHCPTSMEWQQEMIISQVGQLELMWLMSTGNGG